MPSNDDTRRDWEVIQQNETDKTERLKIVGGWLYRVITSASNLPTSVSVVFVSE